MTGARARFGILVGVIVALLCAGLVGVWAVDRQPRSPVRAGPRGHPGQRRGYDPRRPQPRRGARRAGRRRQRAVEAYEQAKEQGKAGQSGKLSLCEGQRWRRRCAGRHVGRRGPDRYNRRRLGAGHRGRPECPMGLRPHDPLRLDQAMPGQLPDAVDRARDQRRTAARRSAPASRCAPARAPASSTRSSRSCRARAPSTRCT